MYLLIFLLSKFIDTVYINVFTKLKDKVIAVPVIFMNKVNKETKLQHMTDRNLFVLDVCLGGDMYWTFSAGGGEQVAYLVAA